MLSLPILKHGIISFEVTKYVVCVNLQVIYWKGTKLVLTALNHTIASPSSKVQWQLKQKCFFYKHVSSCSSVHSLTYSKPNIHNINGNETYAHPTCC